MGFFDLLIVLVITGIPGGALIVHKYLEERRLERTNPERLLHEYNMRRLELEHQEKFLALPAPERDSNKG